MPSVDPNSRLPVNLDLRGTFNNNSTRAQVPTTQSSAPFLAVVEASQEQPGKMLLNIGKQQLPLPEKIPVQAGQQVLVQITNNHTLKVLDWSPKQLPEVLRQVVTQSLNHQNSLPDLLETLKNFAQATQQLTDRTSLSKTELIFIKTLQTLYNNIRESAKIHDGDSLKRAIGNSGIQMEARLFKEVSRQTQDKTTAPGAKTQPSLGSLLNQDTKAQLLRVIAHAERALAGSEDPATPHAEKSAPLKRLQQLINDALTRTANRTKTHRTATSLPPSKPIAANVNVSLLIQSLTSAQTQHFRPHEVSIAPPPFPFSTFIPPSKPDLPKFSGKDWIDGAIKALMMKAVGSLLRIQLQQITNLTHLNQSSDNNQTILQTELPFLYQGEVCYFNFLLEKTDPNQNPENGKEQETVWQVNLAFDLKTFGPVQAQIQLRGQATSTTLWSDSSTFLKLADEHFPELQKTLEQLGLTVEPLKCHEGLPSHPKAILEHRLVDVRT